MIFIVKIKIYKIVLMEKYILFVDLGYLVFFCFLGIF